MSFWWWDRIRVREGNEQSMFKRFLSLSVLFTLTVSAQVAFIYSKSEFSARGSWESPDPNVKTGMTETQIDCFRKSNTCVMATADNAMGRPHVFTNYLDVIKWDDNGLIATDSSPICMTLTMQVSFADKHVTLAHSLKRLDPDKAEACKFFGAEKTTEDIFVLQGSPRWDKEHQWLPDQTDKPNQHP
jgi:hypothetical protein